MEHVNLEVTNIEQFDVVFARIKTLLNRSNSITMSTAQWGICKDLVIKQLQDQLHELQRKLSGSNSSTITIDAIAQKGSKDKTRGFAAAASLVGTSLAPKAY